MEGRKEFVQIDSNDLFPYLLVNIGSGVSIIKVLSYFIHIFFFTTPMPYILQIYCKFDFAGLQVDGDGIFQRVSGTNVGGGTYWGLGRLLTKCKRLS